VPNVLAQHLRNGQSPGQPGKRSLAKRMAQYIRDDPVAGMIGDVYQGAGELVKDTASDMWGNMHPMDKAALGTSLIPGVGDAIGLAADVRMFAEEPESRTALNYGLAGLGALPLVPSLAMVKAYHGTPHKVDKFRMDKIGTGEGAQAFGHGLYFAENPKVAGEYRDALSMGNPEVKYRGKELEVWTGEGLKEGENMEDHFASMFGYKSDPSQAREAHVQYLEGVKRHQSTNMDMPESVRKRILDDIDEQLVSARSFDPSQVEQLDKGTLYNVELDVNHEDLLDWDAPIGEQSPKIKEKLKAAGLYPETTQEWKDIFGDDWNAKRTDTSDLVWGLGRKHGEAEASLMLKEAGIPGIRYLDAGSRGAKEGTRNLVIFDEDLIKIADEAKKK
jgi:hypothetical protein